MQSANVSPLVLAQCSMQHEPAGLLRSLQHSSVAMLHPDSDQASLHAAFLRGSAL